MNYPFRPTESSVNNRRTREGQVTPLKRKEVSVNKFRWGILGAGFAARKFVHGLRAAPDAEAVLVASRSPDKAREFARQLRIPRAAGSYAEAIQDGEKVDAFYLATPSNTHREYALQCLHAGRPILVEKPFALNATEAREIVEAARARAVFCMEAMWTRFLPLVRDVKRLIEQGALGDIRMFTGSFGTAETVRPDSKLFDARARGGATLDRGVYPISLAFHFLGVPDEISSKAIIGETGVDEDIAAVFRYDRGTLALINASLRTQALNECVIMGTRAQVRIHAPIYRPFRMTVTPVQDLARSGETRNRFEVFRESHWVHSAYQRFNGMASTILGRNPKQRTGYYAGNGYHYEAEEVMSCVREGRHESRVMPLTQSLQIMQAVDHIRSRSVDCLGMSKHWAAVGVSQPTLDQL